MMNSKDGYQRRQTDDEEIDNSVISSTEKSSVISTGEAGSEFAFSVYSTDFFK